MHTQGITENFRTSYERLVYLHQAKRPRLSVDFLMNSPFFGVCCICSEDINYCTNFISESSERFLLFLPFCLPPGGLAPRDEIVHVTNERVKDFCKIVCLTPY